MQETVGYVQPGFPVQFIIWMFELSVNLLPVSQETDIIFRYPELNGGDPSLKIMFNWLTFVVGSSQKISTAKN